MRYRRLSIEGGLYSIRINIRCRARVVKVSLSPAASIELIYGIPYMKRLPIRSSTYKARTVVRNHDIDQ